MNHEVLARAQAQGTPLIDGRTVTFLWQGKKAPRLIGDFTDWENGEPAVLSKVAPSLWTYQTTFPLDGYLEYIFVDGEDRLYDPLNKRIISNGVGKYNHYFYMPEACPTPLVRRSRSVPQGRITFHKVPTNLTAAGKQRLVTLYQPPVDGPVPLMVVWDGSEFHRRARLTHIVDNLIAQGRIRPIALAMVDNGRLARFIEYACNDATLAFLWSQVLPLARQELNLLDWETHPGAYGIMGASMGGLISLYLAARLSHIFGKVLSMSGAFNFNLGGHNMVIFDLLRNGPRLPLKLWLNIGQYDFRGLITANDQMFVLLRQKGYPFESHIYNAGHNYTAWRNDLWRGLEYLFGG
jgi:enterochelin esterase family protein